MASEAPEGWESVAALQEAYNHVLANLERANAEVQALGSALVKAVRERDSLARRCAARFEEIERMRPVVTSAKAVRELWRYDAMAAAEPEIHTFVAAVDALSTQDGA
mgnify:CR=1 FL=1